MISFKTKLFFVFAVNLWRIDAQISDKRLCIDEQCSVQISEGKTLIRYSSPDSKLLSFAPNTPIKIYSYGAGSLPMYIGVEVNGKRGYINKGHIRETKVFKKPTLLLPTEIGLDKSNNNEVPNSVTPLEPKDAGTKIEPNAVKQEYEIIDGTKIAIEPNFFSSTPATEEISSSTEAVVESNQLSDKNTEKLVIDIKKIENIINVGQNEPSKENIGKLPDIVPANSDPPKNNVDSKNEKKVLDAVNESVKEPLKEKNNIFFENPDTVEFTEDQEIGEEDDEHDNEDDDDNDDDDDDEEEPQEKGFFEKIADTIESFTKEELKPIENENKIILVDRNEGSNINSKAEKATTDSNNLNTQTLEATSLGDVSVHNESVLALTENKNEQEFNNDDKILETVTEDNTINNSFNLKEGKENILESVSNRKDIDTVLLQNSKVEDVNFNQKPIVNVSIIKTSEKKSLESDQTKIPVSKLSEESLVPTPDQNKILSTTPSSFDNEALPFDDFNTENSVLNINANKEQVGEEGNKKLIENENNNEESKTSENVLKKIEPSDLVGFGGLGLGLFNQPKEVNSKELKEETESYKNTVTESLASEKESQENAKQENIVVELLEENLLTSRPDLGPNEPTFIDTSPPIEESKKVLVEEDNNNASDEIKISDQDLDLILNEKPKLAEKKTEGILSSISSFFGGVSGSEEDAKNSDMPKEVVEEPFVKTEAYVTGDSDPNVNNELLKVNNFPEKTEEDLIKTVDTQKLSADRSSEFNSYDTNIPNYSTEEKVQNVWVPYHDNCDTEQYFDVKDNISTASQSLSLEVILQSFSSNMFLYLVTTGVSMVLFLFLYLILDKCKREAPLIASINKLEQELLAIKKENHFLQEQDSTLVVQQPETVIQGVPNELVEELTEQLKEAQFAKAALEEQVTALEKELDNSTEVGIELNRIISDMLNSSDGSEILKENVEQMQKRLVEQQDTINNINENLNLKDTENHELRLELEISNKKVMDLQGEVDEMVEKIVKIEEARDARQSSLEKNIEVYQVKLQDIEGKENGLRNEVQVLKTQLAESQRIAELKIKEFNTLKESLDKIKFSKNSEDTIKSLLEVTEIKALLEQFKSENSRYSEQLRLEQESNVAYATKMHALSLEGNELRTKFEKADKEKLEIKTKLEVLNNYFKEKEEQMQREISKYESLWAVKKGEATSTTERIRLLQEELQNYKAQNESLKQEIMNQEVDLKSQISVLEKKAHESWMTNRQMERKLEDARQEAAQLRNRLTMKERAALEGNNQIRMQSPLLQNGDLPLSPPPLDATLSPPPLLGNPRDLTMSPPIPGMPPLPFLPPPPGGLPSGLPPFMPPPPGGLPPPGMPPFMPPPIFPEDHRPPPLGRMSSPPPLNSRYSPESTIYSEYDRYDDRHSPIYDSEYGASPPNRAYSPYEERLRDERLRDDRRDFRRDEDRREYNRPHVRSNGRTSKGLSSGSENELGKFNRKSNKKV